MKRLPEPNIDDATVINDLAQRERLSSHPMLRDSLNVIVNQYEAYGRVRGDVFNLNAPVAIEPALADAMRGHYSNAVNGLEFISAIRENSSPDVCPMCGSFGTSQVDHVAPKEEYPEYSFFSRNLVPACECNIKKGVLYRGVGIGERVLHPYYDDVMRERLMMLSFSGAGDSPDIEIQSLDLHAANPAVQFHLTNIIKKTKIKIWAIKQWANSQRTPINMFSGLRYRHGDIDFATLRDLILDELNSADDVYETPNNWKSMFMYGLSRHDESINFLVGKINDVRRSNFNVV